jgi:hypothetical protein
LCILRPKLIHKIGARNNDGATDDDEYSNNPETHDDHHRSAAEVSRLPARSAALPSVLVLLVASLSPGGNLF